MDLEDEGWVNIPYDGLLEVHDDGGKKFFSRKFVRSPKNLFKMDYFDSSKKSEEFVDSSLEDDPRSPKKLIPFPIHIDDHPVIVDHHEEVKEITKLPILINEELNCAPESDQDQIFQVFFKKENEFVEMKLDSPRSGSRRISSPYIETDMFQFEDKSDDDDDMFNVSSPSKVVIDDVDEKVIKGEENERLNIWKWSLNGIGAFFSLGMAAATICIILFGNGQRHKQNQKIRIQLYSDDKV